MPSRDPDDLGGEAPLESTRRQRFTGAISNFALKPTVAAENGTGNASSPTEELTTVPELEAAVKRSNDKERLVGLLMAPVAAGIGFLVTTALVANDPKVPSPHHVNPSQYTELGLLTMALALVMLGTAWFRKRTLLRDRHGPVRTVTVQPALLGLRGPVHPDRLVVPGPRLPAAGEAQAGQGRRRRGLPSLGLQPAGLLQAVHATRRPAPAGPEVEAGQGHRSGLSGRSAGRSFRARPVHPTRGSESSPRPPLSPARVLPAPGVPNGPRDHPPGAAASSPAGVVIWIVGSVHTLVTRL